MREELAAGEVRRDWRGMRLAVVPNGRRFSYGVWRIVTGWSYTDGESDTRLEAFAELRLAIDSGLLGEKSNRPLSLTTNERLETIAEEMERDALSKIQ